MNSTLKIYDVFELVDMLNEDQHYGRIITKNPCIKTLKTGLKKYYCICEMCKDKKALIIHHKDKNRTHNSLINFQLLCKVCHYKIHHSQVNYERIILHSR